MDNSTSQPLTEDLLEEFLNHEAPLSTIDDVSDSQLTIEAYLQKLLEDSARSKADVIKCAHLNPTFAYQIFNGQRNPKRDKVLQLSFGLACDLRQTNRLLKLSGASDLYVKNRRDAIIIYCIRQRYSIDRTDEELYRFGESTIQESDSE